MHPSIEENRRRIGSPPPGGAVDSLKYNVYDRDLLGLAFEKSKKVGSLVFSIDEHFVENAFAG